MPFYADHMSLFNLGFFNRSIALPLTQETQANTRIIVVAVREDSMKLLSLYPPTQALWATYSRTHQPMHENMRRIVTAFPDFAPESWARYMLDSGDAFILRAYHGTRQGRNCESYPEMSDRLAAEQRRKFSPMVYPPTTHRIKKMRRLYNRVSQSVISLLTSTSTNIRIRPRFSGDFWTIFVGWLLLVVFVWYIDLIDDLYGKTTLTLLCSALPLLALFSEPSEDASQRRWSSWMWRVWGAFFIFAVLIGISDKWNLPTLGVSVTMIGVSSPLLAICLFLSLKKRLLGFALMPSIIAAMLHAVAFAPGDRLYGMLISIVRNIACQHPHGQLPDISFCISPNDGGGTQSEAPEWNV